jgi:hypothetical protein
MRANYRNELVAQPIKPPVAGDVIELPIGVYMARGTWVFAMSIKGKQTHLFCDKDYNKVIAFANQWHNQHRKD